MAIGRKNHRQFTRALHKLIEDKELCIAVEKLALEYTHDLMCKMEEQLMDISHFPKKPKKHKEIWGTVDMTFQTTTYAEACPNGGSPCPCGTQRCYPEHCSVYQEYKKIQEGSCHEKEGAQEGEQEPT